MATRSERIWRRFEQLGLVDWWRMEDVSSWCDRIDGEAVKRAIESGKLDGIAVILPYTVSGDYVGSRVETSNCRTLLEAYPETVWERLESHGSSMAMVWLRDMVAVLSESHEHHGLLDDLEYLQRYPVLDECLWSQLELEDANECWDSFGAWDTARRLRDMGYDVDEDDVNGLPWWESDDGRGHHHSEGCSYYFDYAVIADWIVEHHSDILTQQEGA